MMKSAKGSSLIETVIALALIGIIGVAFLSALAGTSNARVVADEHTTARILAESQMEYLKKAEYSPYYDDVTIPDEYAGYSSVIDVDTMRNGQIQKITVTVRHRGKDIESLECFKVNR